MQALVRLSSRRVSVEKWGGMLHRPMSGGKLLSEEEKARENVYIKKMEKERLEKLKKEGHHEDAHASTSTATGSTESKPAPSTESSMNTAVWAGIGAAAIGGYFLFSGSSTKKEEK
eukprot:TRINITY_DN1221_c0_g1_i1.p1 TRINITY_DN1221_c0_g1~~TRINITY_DN1221_c0_g1_i1.p1  ORF type:complete len:116 (-),score=25.32 TRINITY_DN1221_c0_g1_i1:821-1168(-)